jgi:YXWGXW repeat-containing protein
MQIRMRSRYFLFLIALLFLVPAASYAQISVGVSIHIGPPALPVYTQPPCPQEGFLWTPGYWAYGSMGYYWVPGVWVAAPHPGFLWTPGYWGFVGGVYGWHGGYWGPHVGFYGGINYGFGYGGVGFGGGEWVGGAFRYNTAVMNVDRTVVHNVYVNNTVIRNTTVVNHASFNGEGGIVARPSPQEEAFAHENHVPPTANQLSHEQAASSDRSQWASSNHGKPANVAMDRVNGRSFNQQGRIANGVASGKLTPHETQNLENREGHINNEVRSDRAANGGKLTPAEHAQVNHQQNNVSRSIYDDKHNAAAQHSEQKTNTVASNRSASGGKPAPHEHAQGSKVQSKTSKPNHEEKQNGKTPKR